MPESQPDRLPAPSEEIVLLRDARPQELVKTICALANRRGGSIYVGADPDGTRRRDDESSVPGVSYGEVDEVIHNLEKRFRDPLPQVKSQVHWELHSGRAVYVVEVVRNYDQEWISLKDGTFWYRDGTLNVTQTAPPTDVTGGQSHNIGGLDGVGSFESPKASRGDLPTDPPEIVKEHPDDDPVIDDLVRGTPPKGWLPIDELFNRDLSPSVHGALELSQRIVRKEAPGHPVNRTYVLYGLIDYGLEPPSSLNSAAFLAGQISAGSMRRYTTYRNRYARHATDWANDYDVGDQAADFVKASAVEMFDRAGELRDKITGGGPICGRHLLYAILSEPVDPVEHGPLKRFEEIGLDRGKLTVDFLKLMANEGPEEERDRWRAAGGQAMPLETTVGDDDKLPEDSDADAEQRGSQIAHFNPDGMPPLKHVLAADCLDIERSVTAMANLIASRTLRPPLSIGLFGAWGSGKSFFIRSLRAAICNITQRSEVTKEVSDHYWPRIVQIEFNAWHYVDANLWASLVSYIFQSLEKGNSESDEAKVIRELKIATTARAAASAALERAKAELSSVKERMERQEKLIEGDIGQLARIAGACAWDGFREELGKSDPKLKQDIENLEQNLQEIGVAAADIRTSAGQFQAEFRETFSLLRQLKAIVAAMFHQRSIKPAVVVGFVVAAVVGIPALATAAWLYSPQIGQLVASVGEVAVALGAIAAWIGAGARHVDNVSERIKQVLKGLDAERARQTTELREELQRHERAYAEAQQAHAEAEQRVKAAEEALKPEDAGEMISNFIKSRSAGDDYRKHLGIVSVIRHDFEKLSGLVKAYNAASATSEPGPEASAAEALAERSKRLGINRVVLYIDDLDRCPPDRVVEVLQAIHLLLAFEMFVVVVAVDSRWVSNSLASHYPNLLVDAASRRGGPDGSNGNSTNGASPRDYLEKIFQIPFWVQPMTSKGYRGLIDSLVDTDSGISATPQAAARTQPGPTAARLPSLAQVAGPHTPDRTRTRTVPPPRPADRTVEAPPDTEPHPERLRFDEVEVAAMKELAPLVGRSPRETKRFVNVYRLLKASQSVVPFTKFVDANDEYRNPILLLAISVGHPRFAAQLFAELRSSEQHQAKFLDVLDSPDSAEDERGRTEVQKFVGMYRHWNLVVNNLAKWVPSVSQFCFEPPLGASVTATAESLP